MGRLIYSAITSLDGFVADESGNFDWAAPDEEVHAFVNDLERNAGTYLYGRRMYEVMVAWETVPTDASEPPVVRDYASIWRSADKVVYSTMLEAASSARTQIERDFDPDKVRRMKVDGRSDITVGGPDLAAQAIKAGLVDECHLFLTPVLVGAGKRSLPNDVRIELKLLDQRRFGNGVLHLHYAIGEVIACETHHAGRSRIDPGRAGRRRLLSRHAITGSEERDTKGSTRTRRSIRS